MGPLILPSARSYSMTSVTHTRIQGPRVPTGAEAGAGPAGRADPRATRARLAADSRRKRTPVVRGRVARVKPKQSAFP
jgi:hypothetical protein